MDFVWDTTKNEWLKRERFVSFEEIAAMIQEGDYQDIIENPTRAGQYCLVLQLRSYTWVVLYVIDEEDRLVLKTAYPESHVPPHLWSRNMNIDDIKLTSEEQEIEDSIEEWVPVSDEAREHLRRIAERSKKSEAINIRMSSFDLSRIKEIAAEQGMPYQTLINVLVHKYVTHQMYEKDELLKTLRVAKETGAI